MNIIRTNAESKKDLYMLTRCPVALKMVDVKGQRIEIAHYAIFDDVGADGYEKRVCSILTPSGEVYGTISKTFIAEFDALVEIFGDELTAINVVSRQSNKGRDFIVCTLAD